jgi:hypothetical protein
MADCTAAKGFVMTPEDEEFNRVEMESRIKKEYVRDMKKRTWQALYEKNDLVEVSARHTIHNLMEDLAVARMLIRELGDRLSKLENAK